MYYYFEKLFGDLMNHYIEGSGTDFDISSYPETKELLEKITITNMPFSGGRASDWSSSFDSYSAPSFKEMLENAYKEEIKNGIELANFPIELSYSTSKIEKDFLSELGDFTVYVSGEILLYEDGRWIFTGEKNIYDYWDFDIKNFPLASFRDFKTFFGSAYLEFMRLQENIDKGVNEKTKPFTVSLDLDEPHYETGKITPPIPMQKKVDIVKDKEIKKLLEDIPKRKNDFPIAYKINKTEENSKIDSRSNGRIINSDRRRTEPDFPEFFSASGTI